MERRPFIYDVPEPLLMRLFKLDLNDVTEPLQGSLFTMTNHGAAFAKLEVRRLLKSTFSEPDLQLFTLLGEGKGYDALSYCWGPSTTRKFPLKLSVIGRKLKDGLAVLNAEPERNGYVWVGESLHEFLLEVRRRKYARFVWIDAVCIDQRDARDKGNQVPVMRHVYEAAENILVWLGPVTTEEQRGFEEMQRVTEALLKAKGTAAVLKDDGRLSSPSTYGSLEFWQTASRILTHPWWTRLWTLQEISMSVNTKDDGSPRSPYAHMYFGSQTHSAPTIEAFVTATSDAGLAAWVLSLTPLVDQSHAHAFDAVREIQLCRAKLARHVGVPLRPLLLATSRRQATMPVDMVWGQIALIGSGTVRDLALDPAGSAVEIFTAFGRYYVEQEVKESLLNHVSQRDRLAGLPSWCPDFASKEETAICLGSRFMGFTKLSKAQKRELYHAGFTHEGRWRIPRTKGYAAREVANLLRSKNPAHNKYHGADPRQISGIKGTRMIRVSGVFLDEVVEVVEVNTATALSGAMEFLADPGTRLWNEKCMSLARRTLATRPNDDDVDGYDLYARTITANRLRLRPRPDVADDRFIDVGGKANFASKYLALERYLHALPNQNTTSDPELQPEIIAFAEVTRIVTHGRRFFASKHGRLGIGPSRTEVGDELCVAFYCPTPYLFRAKSTGQGRERTYELVGEVYVHGLMAGEALSMVDRGEVDEVRIVVE